MFPSTEQDTLDIAKGAAFLKEYLTLTASSFLPPMDSSAHFHLPTKFNSFSPAFGTSTAYPSILKPVTLGLPNSKTLLDRLACLVTFSSPGSPPPTTYMWVPEGSILVDLFLLHPLFYVILSFPWLQLTTISN